MFGKLLILLSLTALAMSIEYPGGVHPAICPDYPNCSPELMARFTRDGMPIPQWGKFYYAAPVEVVPRPAPVPVAKPAARYPADVSPESCPNYPYCS